MNKELLAMTGCFGGVSENGDHSPECLHEASLVQGGEYPTINDFEEAITDFFVCIDIPGSRGVALQKIAAMRKIKTTWAGKEENEMRFRLDRLLEQAGCSVYG